MMCVRLAEFQDVSEPDSLCIDWPWLSNHSASFPTSFSMVPCPSPVIACQINVLLCSRAQKLSSLKFGFHFFLFYFFAFGSVWNQSAYFFKSDFYPLFPPSVSIPSSSLFSAVLPQQFCLLCPLPEGNGSPSSISIFQPLRRFVCSSRLTLMFLHKSCLLSWWDFFPQPLGGNAELRLMFARSSLG